MYKSGVGHKILQGMKGVCPVLVLVLVCERKHRWNILESVACPKHEIINCSGFGCGRAGWADQTSQSNGIFYTMWRHARYFSGVEGWSMGICYAGWSWASGSENIARCMFFLSVLLLLFSSPFAVLLNCFYLNWGVLPFPSYFPPHPTMGRGSERETG